MKNFFRFKYILITIIAIQIFSSLVLMYLGHYQYKSILDMYTKHETVRANKIYKSVFAEINQVYSILGENLLTNEVVNVFAQHDRQKLYQLLLPKFKELQKLNPYVEIIHFHTPDLHSFLRVHKPEKYGDDLSGFRPILLKETEVRKKLYGLEVGKHGVFYRIVLPIFKQNQYIGSMELGIDIGFLMERLNQFSDLHSFMFIVKNQTKLIHKASKKKAQTYLLDYNKNYELLQYYDHKTSEDFLNLIGKNIVTIEDYEILKTDNAVYLAHNGLILKDYANKYIGFIIFVQKINYYFDTVSMIRWISIVTTFTLFLISVLLIYVLIKRYTNTLVSKEKELTKLATTDQLTSIGNRYSFNKIFTNELKVNSRNATSLTFLMIDLDGFKQYNDNYGHPMGDKVLKTVALKMKEMLKRPNDYIFRVGGEEFVILYSGLPYEEAIAYGEALIKSVEELDIEHKHNKPYKNITISIGLCHVVDFTDLSEESVYKKADETLYEAKKDGKNRLVARQYS